MSSELFATAFARLLDVPKPSVHFLVCVNERPETSDKPCCAAREGLTVYQALKDGVRERGRRDDVLVTRTGCLRHCSRGTTVVVWPHNHWYAGVRPADVDELLGEASLSGHEVERLRMPPGPWE